MKANPFGSTGLQVSQLGFGAAEIRGPDAYRGTDISEDQAAAVLNAALDAGINYIDTADDYGLSEERIGRHVGHRRDEFILATKCGYYPEGEPERWGPARSLARDNLWRNLETSLSRLGFDYVDVLQFHDPDPDDVRRHRAVQTLQEMRDQGVVRWIGVSCNRAMGEFFRWGVFDVYQMEYSLFHPQHRQLMHEIADSGGAIVVRGAAGKGGPGPQRRYHSRPHYPDPPDLWALAGLDEVRGSMDPVEMILRYSISHRACQTAIVGTYQTEHIAKNAAAVEAGPLPEPLLAEIDRHMDAARQEHYIPWRDQVHRIRERRRAERESSAG